MKKLSISEQCRRAGINRRTYYDRLARGETNLFAPANRKKYQKITKEVAELLEKNGISKDMYYNRITNGWSVFEASNVLPNAEIYMINGKSVHSQLSKNEYYCFLRRIVDKGMSVEEAFEEVTKNA